MRSTAPRRATIIDGLTFYTSRRNGQIESSDGLFHRDTRYLSTLDVTLDDHAFSFVGADAPSPDRQTLWYATSTSDVTDFPTGESEIPTNLVLARTQRVEEGTGLAERVTLWNHSPSRFSGTLSIEFDVDFVDLFEVRGLSARTDRSIERDVTENAVESRYRYEDKAGDDVGVTSTVEFDESPDRLGEERASYRVELAPQATESFGFTVRVGGSTETPDEHVAGPTGTRRSEPEASTLVATGREDYDRTLERAFSDLRALITRTDHGPVAVAGSPWYAAVFGRDALISAYQTLPFAPEIAAGTLRFLAAHQGEASDGWTDEQPGKILHELRHGELTRAGRVPHSPYYGSVDATLLWIVLLSETYRWFGDRTLIKELWDPLERALGWVHSTTDAIGEDPFLYYRTSGGTDLTHKGWRDSTRSIQFRDGTTATPPLASVEVQGYLYDALRRSATLVREVKGDDDRADRLEERAAELGDRFDEAFWLPDRRFYATALTVDGRQVDSVTSNVGHCLWSGIVPASRTDDVAERLRSSDLFAGWGIRTMSTEDAGYDPVSYHTGSVWPHDTALACLGLTDNGHHDTAESIAEGLLEASTFFPGHSLPEVFCGFDASGPPKPYPSTCVPQAWAAGAPFALLRAVFSLEPRGDARPTIGRTPSIVDSDALEGFLGRWAERPPKTFCG